MKLREHFRELSGLKDFTTWSGRNLQLCVYPTSAFRELSGLKTLLAAYVEAGICSFVSTQRGHCRKLCRLKDFITRTLCEGQNLQLCVYPTWAFPGVVRTDGFHHLEPLWSAEFAPLCLSNMVHFRELAGLMECTTWSFCGRQNLQLCVYPTCAFLGVVWTEGFLHYLEPL